MPALSIAAKRTTITPAGRERHSLVLPGRVTWKDSRGTTRFASVMTRDVSETGVFIEWSESTSIPLYRLVTFQLERDARNIDGLPHGASRRKSPFGRLPRRRVPEVDRHAGRIRTAAAGGAVAGVADLGRPVEATA